LKIENPVRLGRVSIGLQDVSPRGAGQGQYCD
jgi:hypothetical protein